MCGIVGVVSAGGGLDSTIVHRMMRELRHRGPDDSGYVFFYDNGFVEAHDEDSVDAVKKRTMHVERVPGGWRLALGNRRLAILDLSPRGHQPMSNEDKSVWVVFNGEIYNFRELATLLAKRGHELHCDCDTEVLVHGYEEWGINGLLEKIRGMWAFILYDTRSKKLYAVRDPFGIKPLYLLKEEEKGLIAFVSEIKALRHIAKLRPNRNALHKYLLYQPLGQTETFYENVTRLPWATLIEVDLGKPSPHESLVFRRYWQPPLRTRRVEYRRAVEEWRRLFLDSIRLHLRSDVPVGLLLSGGLDSSSIAAAWSHLSKKGLLDRWARSSKPIAFTFSYDGERDETAYARLVAEHYGIRLVTVRVDSPKEILDAVKKLVYYHDEPPLGPSVIAEWFVMQEASRHVRVVLLGQGGDELLAGYQRYVYRYILHLARKGRILAALRELIRFRDVLLEKKSHFFFKIRLARLRRKVAIEATSQPSYQADDYINTMLVNDIMGEGLQRLLHNADRDSMAFSIEARVPFLDRILATYMLSLPGEYKLGNGWTKRIHRDSMKDILLDKVRLRRSKIGFEPPEAEWLKQLHEKSMINLSSIIQALSGHIDSSIVSFLAKLVEKLDKGRLTTPEANMLWRAVFLYYWLEALRQTPAKEE